MIEQYSISITANRVLSDNDKIIIFNKAAELVTNPTIKSIYVGGAIGGDTVFLQACLDIWCMDKPELICVVPCKLKNQPKSTWEISKRADKLIELNNEITAANGFSAYHVRNEYMVNNSDMTIAFWAGDKKSGTYSCLKYAQNINKMTEIVDIEGLDK